MTRVLVIDDDVTFLELTTIALQHAGYAVTSADSVRAGIRAIEKGAPTAMLIDWRLADGSGLDVLRWAQSRNLRIPAAMLTGFWADTNFERARTDAENLGVSICVRRGVDIDPVENVVKSLVDPFWQLHCAVLRNESSAVESLVSQLRSRLIPRLQAGFRNAPAEMVSDAVTDALLEYLTVPTRFDVHLGVPLARFILLAARRNLLNAVVSERRRLAREKAYENARLRSVDRLGEGTIDADVVRKRLRSFLSMESDVSVRNAIERWLQGDRTLQPWMRVVRLAGLPAAEVRREVKRMKDAFVARCKRALR